MLRFPKVFNTLDGFYLLEHNLPRAYNKRIYIILEVDDFPLVEFPRYSIDVEQLLLSLQGTGFYTLLLPGRAFRRDQDPLPDPVHVIHHPTYISWQVKSPLLERTFYFEKQPYTALAERMCTDLLQIVEEYHSDLWVSNIQVDPWSYTEWAFLKPTLNKYKIR